MSMRSFCALAVEACLSFLLLLMVCQLCGSRISFDPTRKLNLKNINLAFADSDLIVVVFFLTTLLSLFVYLFIYFFHSCSLIESAPPNISFISSEVYGIQLALSNYSAHCHPLNRRLYSPFYVLLSVPKASGA